MTNFFKQASKYSDLVAAGAVVLVVVMMIIPLPAFVLDLAITLNVSVALAIVIATLYMPRAIDFSSFPSLLLLTTLFRLAINVSVTRLILLHGDAGNVVSAFGSFVIGGNVVVGLVIFLILVVIQFVVVTAGAGRVAEVGARFTLDAMPGKQTSTRVRSPRTKLASGARTSPARPTSTARWTAPRSSSRATPWRRCSSPPSTSSAASSSAWSSRAARSPRPSTTSRC
jgi:hypothetical protein